MADGLSSPSDNPNFQLIPCIILHDLYLLCSFIISHPLYSSYFIFFAPYLIKLISFMSPLFIAAVLLSLLLTTTTAFGPKLPQLELLILEFLIQELKSNLYYVDGEEECSFEDFEVYKIMFDGVSSIRIGIECDEEVSTAAKILEVSVHDGWRNDISAVDLCIEKLGLQKILENSVRGDRRNEVTINDLDVVHLADEKGLGKLFEELDSFEDCTAAIEASADSDKVTGELRKAETIPVNKVVRGSEEEGEMESVAVNSSDNYKFSQNSRRSSSWSSNSSSIFSRNGSMREEKEWRRTLACKLFEERHNSLGGEEGMDSLWEAYENNNSKNRKEIMIKNDMTVNSNNGEFQSSDDDEDDDEQGMSNGHLCCLQALKFSTGKMNLGMRKPNLVKISKALKGFGWLHHVKNKHGKKS